MLECVQSCAMKYILNDYTSTYKSRLQQLQMLPLTSMYIHEFNDLMFFKIFFKFPIGNFNIRQYISFTNSNTRSGDHLKLVHPTVDQHLLYTTIFTLTVLQNFGIIYQ